MKNVPTIEEISRLIESSKLVLAIERLDELLSYHAQLGEINKLVHALEDVNARYPHIEAIRWRLQTVYHKLGRTGSDTE